ncbi:MAG: DMT family transporter [Devosia sp.]
MALAIAAFTLFAVHDALVKSVVYALPVVQILFVRSVVIVAICLVVRRDVMQLLLKSPNKYMHLLRGVLTLAAWLMYYTAARDLQLAEMTTLYYVAPVITIVLAVIFLKERLTLARVGAAAIGFFGVVVAMNPTGVTVALPELMVLCAAFFWAIAMILMRTISKADSSVVLIFSMNLFFVIFMGIASIPGWVAMDGVQWLIVIAVGLVGGTAQYVLVEAARLAPASVIGTAEYGALIWSFVFGFAFWGELPAGSLYLGAGLVIVSGLVLAWNEHRTGKKVDAP